MDGFEEKSSDGSEVPKDSDGTSSSLVCGTDGTGTVGMEEEACLLFPKDGQVALEWMAVLSSQRIRYDVIREKHLWRIRVRQSGQFSRATREIEAYENDREYFRRFAKWRTRGRLSVARFRRSDLTLAVIFVFALFYAYVGPAERGNPWGDSGAMDVFSFRNGEWWRAITALTLHADLPHLLGNLGFLFLFMTPVCHVFGGGCAWLLLLVSAAFGNVATVAIYARGEMHSSVGASTAVFAALGILAASRVMAGICRTEDEPSSTLRPVLAAIGILALTGFDPTTDIAAHVMGFVSGFVFSILAWVFGIPDLFGKKNVQGVTTVLFFLGFFAAWSRAMGMV
jgi:membrane associated rhomboid family serine protease